MKNTKAYLNWHYIILTILVLFAANALIMWDYENLMFTIPFLIPVGIVQLITGIDYSTQNLPDEFAKDWRTYWSITALYFVILAFLYQSDSAVGLYQFWLFVTPWFISIYQFTIVQRIYKWRSSKSDGAINHIHTKS